MIFGSSYRKWQHINPNRCLNPFVRLIYMLYIQDTLTFKTPTGTSKYYYVPTTYYCIILDSVLTIYSPKSKCIICKFQNLLYQLLFGEFVFVYICSCLLPYDHECVRTQYTAKCNFRFDSVSALALAPRTWRFIYSL